MLSMSKTPLLMDQLREAIETDGRSAYRISKDTGIDAAVLSRFLNGTAGMRLEAVESLCAYLGLKLVKRTTKDGDAWQLYRRTKRAER
jgi:hypothetical protein